MHRFLFILFAFFACFAGHLRAQPANVQADPTTGALFRPAAATFISGNSLLTTTSAASTYQPLNARLTEIASSLTPTYTPSGTVFAQLTKSANSYAQFSLKNSSTGTAASADFIVENDGGTDTTNYGDFGINSSTFTGASAFSLPSGVYLYAQSGSLALGTVAAQPLNLATGDTNRLTISGAGAIAFPLLTTNGFLQTTGGTGALSVGSTLAVTLGGTGRQTSTTAYGLLAAGTTATGAQQTLAAGLTTQVLVGGGASALPVWTTVTGTGSPVLATSPTITTPTISSITAAAASDLSLAGATAGTNAVKVTNSTASTSPTTGAFQVAGGVGISGATWMGGRLNVSSVFSTPGRFESSDINASIQIHSTAAGANSAGYQLISGGTGSVAGAGGFGIYDSGAGAIRMTINSTGAASFSGALSTASTTASTSTTTGALQVAGGVGVAGAMNVGGILTVTSASGSSYGLVSTTNADSLAYIAFTPQTGTGKSFSVGVGGPGATVDAGALQNKWFVRNNSASTRPLTIDGTTDAATFSGPVVTSSATLSGAGAIPITTSLVKFTSTSAANALTLANGVDGQRLTIVHDLKGTLGTGVITPTIKTGFSTITLTNAGDTVSLVYVTTRGWMVTGSYGATVAP